MFESLTFDSDEVVDEVNMDNIPTGSMPMAATLSGNNSRLVSYPTMLPWVWDGVNGAIGDLAGDLNAVFDSQQSGLIPMEPLDRAQPGLIHYLPNTWPAPCGPPPANSDEAVGSHAPFGYEPVVFPGGWDTVLNSETNSSLHEPQFYNTCNLNTNSVTDVNHVLHRADVGIAVAKPKPQTTQTRERHQHSEWEEVIDKHIRRLYCNEGHTAEEVRFAMSVIHDFESSLSTIRKKVAGLKKSERSRKAKRLPQGIAIIPKVFDIILEKDRSIRVEKRRRERHRRKDEGNRNRGHKGGPQKRHAVPNITEVSVGPFLSTVYIHQEELFHAIDTCLKGLFAAGDKSWSADARHFRPPPSTPDFSETWQRLSDQVASVKMLVWAQLYHHANFMLGQVLAGVRAAAHVCDPSFMVHLWTICRILAGLPFSSRKGFEGSPWLGWFLKHLRQIFSSAFGKHPLVVIVDSLLHVCLSSPRDLKATLGLGQWKAIHTLGGLIGNGHSIVLNMGVSCTKAWKGKFSVESTTIKSLYRQSMAIAPNLEAEQRAEVSLNYLSAASREKYNDLDVIHEARHLLSWTREICREKADRRALQYDSVTRAFVFSSELVATHNLEAWKMPEQGQDKQPEFNLSHKNMDEAIEILRYGDLQCRIWAASFSKRLETWIKGNRQKKGSRSRQVAMEEERKKALEERARMREIVHDISKVRLGGPRPARRLLRARRRVPRDERSKARNLLLASLSEGLVPGSQK